MIMFVRSVSPINGFYTTNLKCFFILKRTHNNFESGRCVPRQVLIRSCFAFLLTPLIFSNCIAASKIPVIIENDCYPSSGCKFFMVDLSNVFIANGFHSNECCTLGDTTVITVVTLAFRFLRLCQHSATTCICNVCFIVVSPRAFRKYLLMVIKTSQDNLVCIFHLIHVFHRNGGYINKSKQTNGKVNKDVLNQVRDGSFQ